jgi:PAS domain S-box-containing protein
VDPASRMKFKAQSVSVAGIYWSALVPLRCAEFRWVRLRFRLPFVSRLMWALFLCVLIGRSAFALDPRRGASQYRYEEWSADEGLPYPAVRALGQSDDGYLWLATRDGLARFDGARVVPFTTANLPELKHNGIHTCERAPDGSMWFGTERGVVAYKDGRWWRPKEFEPVADESIRFLVTEANGDVLIGGRQQLYRLRGGKCEKFPFAPDAKISAFNHAVRRRSGEIVICARPMVFIKGDEYQVMSTAQGIVDNEVLSVAEDREGTLWIGTLRGMQRLKDGKITTYTVKDGLPVNIARNILVDRDDNLWIGTPNGLTRMRDGRFENVIINGVEKLGHVLCSFEDRDGNVWGGTDTGFFRLGEAPFVNISQRDGLQASSVFSVLPTSDGSVWVGTWGGGLTQMKNGEILRTYRTDDGLIEDGIFGLAEHPSGKLWFCNYGRGLGSFDGKAFTHYGAPEGAAERVVRVTCSATGDVWMVQENIGPCRLENGKFVAQPVVGLSRIRALLAAKDNTIWVAGDEGMARSVGDKWEVFKRGKRGDLTQAIFEDDRGGVWVLRDGGELDYWLDGKIRTVKFPRSVGPLAFGCARRGSELWICFRFGVVRVEMQELFDAVEGKKLTMEFDVFDEGDGMRSRAPNVAGSPCVAAMPDGSVWFATSKGISYVIPEQVQKGSAPPRVMIESMHADKKLVAPADAQRIAPGRGEVEIEYTATSFVAPSRVAFRHRLVGLDSHWTEPTRARRAYYGGLKPGHYRFEVIGSAHNGLWSATPTVLEFTILPAFYQTWWFWFIVLAVIVGIGVAVHRVRMRVLDRRAQALARQNAELEQRIEARTAELAKSNEALKSSQYFYHSLVESLPQIILRKDVNGRIQYANAPFGELMRRPLQELIGKVDYELCSPEVGAKLRADDTRVLESGEVMEHEHYVDRDGEPRRYLHCKRVPLYDNDRRPIGVQVLFWDMTRFRQTEESLKEAQRELVETSRLAGIAEMATGVLHNIGNALNSVNISVSVATETLRNMKTTGVARVAEMLAENRLRLAEFLTADPRGKQLPEYLQKLSSHLEAERARSLKELASLEQNVGHIKEIVVAQQSHARVSGVTETIPVEELIEFALKISESVLVRRGIVVSREFMPTPPVKVPKQKVLQILVNIIRNACDALEENGRRDKRISIAVSVGDSGKIHVAITDNGVGISEENITRIFAFGFTTKKTGHGFGLHSSALAAREIDGALNVSSPGLGKGATFTLELPPSDQPVAGPSRPPSSGAATGNKSPTQPAR